MYGFDVEKICDMVIIAVYIFVTKHKTMNLRINCKYCFWHSDLLDISFPKELSVPVNKFPDWWLTAV